MYSKKLLNVHVADLARENEYTFDNLMAVIKVESGGIGFAEDGKIIIQFEPSWFIRKAPKEYSEYLQLKKAGLDRNFHLTSDQSKKLSMWTSILANGVDGKALEWKAFNFAFAINPNAAMESTSVGLMQVMGFHYSLLGFKTVGSMWDYAKVSERNQLDLAIRFIKSNKKLDQALKSGDAATFAYYYNGSGYKQFKYDTRLIAAGMKKL